MVTLDSNGKATVHMFGTIGEDFWSGEGITAKGLLESLTAAGVDPGAELEILIHSPGGDVFEGLAIMGVLQNYVTRGVVMGLAASMASVIAVSCDEIEMVAGSELMLHNPWTMVAGDSEDLRKHADHLDQLKTSLVNTYKKRFKEDDVSAIMDAETWMTAESAVEKGVADRIRAGRPTALAFVQAHPISEKSRYIIAAKADPRTRKMEEQAKQHAETICELTEQLNAVKADLDAKAEMLSTNADSLQALEAEKAELEKSRDILQVRIDGLEQDTARKIALASHEPLEVNPEPGEPVTASIWDKYKGITDRAERLKFFQNNKAEILRAQPKGA